jgi:hypothetical protein
LTLIAIPGEPDAVQVDSALASRPPLRELVAEHDDIVVIPEPLFGTMQRCDVSSNARAGAFHESQFVPQRLDQLAPLMEIGGLLAPPGAGHRVAASVVYSADARRQRAKLTMVGLPAPGVPSNLPNALIDLPLGSAATGCLPHQSPVSSQLTMDTSEAAVVQDAPSLGPECFQRFEHDIRVSQS